MTRKNDRPKKKLRDKKRPVRIRLTNAHNETDRNRLFDLAESRATLGKYQLAAGTWQHPRTGLWQVWMSSYGSDINWISTHHDPDRAQQDVEEIKATGQRGDLSDEEKVVALFDRLIAGGDGEPEDVDAAAIATITASISGRVFEARQPESTQAAEHLTIVLAELVQGKASVGFRLGQGDMVDFFTEDLEPADAAKLVADISQGRVDLEELSRRPMRKVYFPVDQAQAEPQPTVEYRYTLPADDGEVVVSGIAMAIIDIAKQVPLPDAHSVQERALWHCEMSRKHIRTGELTNDYEGFKQLFIANYTSIYERDPRELGGSVRDIINRYPLEVALVEIRNIVKGLYFPNIADLGQLAMEYQGIMLTPHKSLDGYYASYSWRGTIMRTPDLANPMLALGQAQHMIDKEQQ
jgi:hypothetical protein